MESTIVIAKTKVLKVVQVTVLLTNTSDRNQYTGSNKQRNNIHRALQEE